jgi:hypothetical protein
MDYMTFDGLRFRRFLYSCLSESGFDHPLQAATACVGCSEQHVSNPAKGISRIEMLSVLYRIL